jgi:hypothetical protein
LSADTWNTWGWESVTFLCVLGFGWVLYAKVRGEGVKVFHVSALFRVNALGGELVVADVEALDVAFFSSAGLVDLLALVAEVV